MQRDPFPDSTLGELEFVYSARPSILPSCSMTRLITSSILFSSFDSFFSERLRAVVWFRQRWLGCPGMQAVVQLAVERGWVQLYSVEFTDSFSARCGLNPENNKHFRIISVCGPRLAQRTWPPTKRDCWPPPIFFCSRVDGSFSLAIF